MCHQFDMCLKTSWVGDKCDLTHLFWFRLEAALRVWILLSLVARSGQQPRGHCGNSLSCKRPLVERLSPVWSSHACGVGLFKNSLQEEGLCRCHLFFSLMSLKPLTPLFSTKKELAQTFGCIHTEFILTQLVHTVHINYWCQTLLLTHQPLILLAVWF